MKSLWCRSRLIKTPAPIEYMRIANQILEGRGFAASNAGNRNEYRSMSRRSTKEDPLRGASVIVIESDISAGCLTISTDMTGVRALVLGVALLPVCLSGVGVMVIGLWGNGEWGVWAMQCILALIFGSSFACVIYQQSVDAFDAFVDAVKRVRIEAASGVSAGSTIDMRE